jgi:hypothetical protein
MCCQEGFYTEQYDVDTAFLNGKLEEDVFIHPPDGVGIKVCKLNRSLYGLKQAAATWYKTISTVFVKKLGFKHCTSDSCIFVRFDGSNAVYIALYVDDLLIGAKSRETIEVIKSELESEFKLKTLGQARFILGMEVDYNREAKQLTISISACIMRMVERFGQTNAKSVSNPNVQGQFLTKATVVDPSMEGRPYRSLVGSLLYVATTTRPNIAFSVCQLSRHLEMPTQEHWKAAVRVLRYLKTTNNKGLHYSGYANGLKLCAYSDADWATNKDNRRSTSGIMVMMNDTPVTF